LEKNKKQQRGEEIDQEKRFTEGTGGGEKGASRSSKNLPKDGGERPRKEKDNKWLKKP